MSYFTMLTGKDWSRYLNKTGSVGLTKAYRLRQIGDLTVNAVKCLHFHVLHHTVDWNEKYYDTVNVCIPTLKLLIFNPGHVVSSMTIIIIIFFNTIHALFFLIWSRYRKGGFYHVTLS